jgi:hypothetical protein
MKVIIDTAYMVIGVFIMLGTIGIGVIGFIKVWREINKIKDTKE